ncbi:Aste57867_25371 [Aphanomyces stellatus]|uniref:Aste57867_25371 protein n=1 Tax=Aphanomyces stellatus TaxID=120398 RepID=A0A485LXP1_9STRA|nr:hypothetical protein As57867_025293 [Aphanomyces stellatus]VFU01996.1 Aste57867_25371 [Aphanomyces stellatus]
MPTTAPPGACTGASPVERRGFLTEEERRGAYEMVLVAIATGYQPNQAFASVALRFQCHARTVQRLWKQAQLSHLGGNLVADTTLHMKRKCGSKCKRTDAEIEAAIRGVGHHDRQTLRSLEAKSAIPETILIRHKQKNPAFKAKSGYLKPLLTTSNQHERIRWAMSFLRPRQDGSHFFVKRKFYGYDDEVLALRAAKSKRFLTKVMFLAAVARPRYDVNRKRIFDGKIGIWPFVEKSPAKRKSKNRAKGTLVTKSVSVDSAVYTDMVLNNFAMGSKSIQDP